MQFQYSWKSARVAPIHRTIIPRIILLPTQPVRRGTEDPSNAQQPMKNYPCIVRLGSILIRSAK